MKTPDHPDEVALRRHGRSFYWARRFLGERHGDRATRLYGFCRTIDDLADQAADPVEAAVRLAAIRQRLAQGRVREPWLVDALRLFRHCGIPLWVPQLLIEGAEWDLSKGVIDDEADLIRYSFKVAGTVGLMMCGVLDVRSPRAWPHAIDLGIAMQLTNIARDVAEDAAMGRRYLPLKTRPPLELDVLIEPPTAVQPVLSRTVLDLLDLADRYYDSGLQGLSYLPVSARFSILVAARLYQAIGHVLRSENGAYWHRRITLSTAQKRRVTLGALNEPFRTVHFWRPTQAHDARLHLALQDLMSSR